MPVKTETVDQLRSVLAQLETELETEVPVLDQSSTKPCSIKASIQAIRSVLGDTEAILALKSRTARKPTKKAPNATDFASNNDATATSMGPNEAKKKARVKTTIIEPPLVFRSLNTFQRLADPNRDEEDDFEPTWKELADMVEIDIQAAAMKRRKEDFEESTSLRHMLTGLATLHRTTLDHVENHVALYHRQDDLFMEGLKDIIARGKRVSQDVVESVGDGLDP